jgi:hypothetical protein
MPEQSTTPNLPSVYVFLSGFPSNILLLWHTGMNWGKKEKQAQHFSFAFCFCSIDLLLVFPWPRLFLSSHTGGYTQVTPDLKFKEKKRRDKLFSRKRKHEKNEK